MSLKTRLDSVQSLLANNGCRTCSWLEGISKADRAALDSWLDAGKSVAQLWDICVAEGLPVSQTPFRHHLKHHVRADA